MGRVYKNDSVYKRRLTRNFYETWVVFVQQKFK